MAQLACEVVQTLARLLSLHYNSVFDAELSEQYDHHHSITRLFATLQETLQEILF